MGENVPLWMLLANCAIGMALIVWMGVTLIPFLAGFQPVVPGLYIAFPLCCVWAGLNATSIMRWKP